MAGDDPGREVESHGMEVHGLASGLELLDQLHELADSPGRQPALAGGHQDAHDACIAAGKGQEPPQLQERRPVGAPATVEAS